LYSVQDDKYHYFGDYKDLLQLMYVKLIEIIQNVKYIFKLIKIPCLSIFHNFLITIIK
jgi:hypothetical protein